MSFNGLRLEYALEENSNYITWKENMEVVLEDNGLKAFIDADVLQQKMLNFLMHGRIML